MKFDPILDYTDDDEEFESYYRIVQSKIVQSYNWYKKQSHAPRILFRITGLIVIVFSITIPVVSANTIEGKDMYITLMAMTIAISSGFNSFYRWGEKWQSFIRSELAILHLIGLWQVSLTFAKKLDTDKERYEAAGKATERLLEEVGKIVSTETVEYFSKVDWPKKQD
ncbi:DUF4231 domain-containing protein [Rheinheimera oceanensis]|uniref:DUF4231 domain-containing protein n=1 Tax=Rheinheimera oceanensis TaxID=2817449 RepID=UPI001BFD04F5|nr:DUF4231 domain-containing protein [Rheinheimera oceanensis]